MAEYKSEVEQEHFMKPKLYYYPDADKPSAIFDFEELENQDAMLVLCVRQDTGHDMRMSDCCYVWKGYEFDPENHPEKGSLTQDQFV